MQTSHSLKMNGVQAKQGETSANWSRWSFVHKWSSLICTLFLLMLCITGAPLIFHHEIERLTGDAPSLPTLSANQNAQRVSMDIMVNNALVEVQKTKPQLKVAQFILIDKDDSRLVSIILNTKLDAQPETGQMVPLDARTGKLLAEPKPEEGFMYVMFKLHTDMFAGIIGTLFLGLMGLLFVVAIISGVVLYAPFMRKLNFAQIRTTKTKQIKWLDWHNLIGIVTVAWLFVVGFTGSINTIGDPMIKFWQVTRMAEMVKPFAHLPSVEKVGALQVALDNAQATLPSMSPFVIAMPGTAFASKRHINIFMRGNTPVTARMYQPVLIDGQTSQLAATEPPPWYLNALFLSQPLHFGDYGGMPLKIVWLLLDLLAIVVLVSGLYLWWKKRSVGEA